VLTAGDLDPAVLLATGEVGARFSNPNSSTWMEDPSTLFSSASRGEGSLRPRDPCGCSWLYLQSHPSGHRSRPRPCSGGARSRLTDSNPRPSARQAEAALAKAAETQGISGFLAADSLGHSRGLGQVGPSLGQEWASARSPPERCIGSDTYDCHVTSGPSRAGPTTERPPVSLAAVRSPLAAVRRPPDPFSLLEVSVDGAAPHEESYDIARELSIAVAGGEILEAHVGSLAVVPPKDMRRFRSERGRILFADSFLSAVESDLANRLRGGPLEPIVRPDFIELDEGAAPVFGIYAPDLHALVFTPKHEPLNHERVTLHEMGHALTLRMWLRTAHLYPHLLDGLPSAIRELLKGYAQGTDRVALRERVLEVFAEAYVWLLAGRERELAQPLLSELLDTLNDRQLRLAS
jgi:hypothetical protein